MATEISLEEPSCVAVRGDVIHVVAERRLLRTQGDALIAVDGVDPDHSAQLALSPDGKSVYVQPGSKIVRHDLVDGRVLDTWSIGKEGASALLPDPDGQHLYAVNADVGCALKKLTHGKKRASKTFYLGRNVELAWLEPGTLIAVERFAWTIDSQTMEGRELDWLPYRAAGVTVRESQVLVGAPHGVDRLNLDDVTKPTPWWEGPEVTAMAQSPGGDYLVVGTTEGVHCFGPGETEPTTLSERRGLGENAVRSLTASDTLAAWVLDFRSDDDSYWESVAFMHRF